MFEVHYLVMFLSTLDTRYKFKIKTVKDKMKKVSLFSVSDESFSCGFDNPSK